jgi:iron(III) transport system substrate-binding protein
MTMMHRRSFISACLAVAIGVAGSAHAAMADWKSDWDKALKDSEGQDLNLIVQPNEGYDGAIAAFKKKYPKIKVQVTLINPSDVAERLLTEQKNGVFAWDAWWATASNMNSVLLPAGGLEKMTDYLLLPEVTDMSNWQNPKFLYTSDRGPYVFIHTNYLQNLGIYNSKLVPGGTLTEDQLLDPSLKGKIAIRAPSRPHSGTMMLAGIAKDKSLDFVKSLLTEQQPQFNENDRQNTMSVLRGGMVVGIGVTENVMTECQKEGGCENLKPLPSSGYMHSRGISVLKNAPHKAAATVFVNWLLSKEGQETYVREWAKFNTTSAFSMRKDVKPDPKHLDSMPDFNNLDKYVAVSFDSGEKAINDVIKTYQDARRK